MTYDYDLFVIGAGSGGVRAARLAAQLGLKVAVAEEDRPGGTCVLRGCVPKKFMVYASSVPESVKYANGFGWDANIGAFDWAGFKATMQAELTRLSGIYETNLKKAGVEVISARASFADDHHLNLAYADGSTKTVSAKTILIAVGGWPFVPDTEGAREHALTSNDMFTQDTLPNSIVVVGGGYIAVEFAGIMNGLGVATTLVYRGQQILRGFDDEVRDHLHAEMTARGVTIMTEANPVRIERQKDGLCITLNSGQTLKADQILYASGRRPKTVGLGLDAAGIATDDQGAIKVDGFSRTNAPHIYAIGDVTNRVNLTPVAIREAVAFVETAFKDNPQAYDHDTIPTAVFSQPEIGTVGLSEQDAISKGIEVDIYTTRFRPMKTTFIKGESRIFMKLVVDKATQKVIGCHMVGPDSGEIIQMAGIAVKHGLTKDQWDATCAVHPTAAEEFVTLKDKRA